jgi:hypothetical protein
MGTIFERSDLGLPSLEGLEVARRLPGVDRAPPSTPSGRGALPTREILYLPGKAGLAFSAHEPLVDNGGGPGEAQSLPSFRRHGELSHEHVAVALLQAIENFAPAGDKVELALNAQPRGEGARHFTVLDVGSAGSLEVVLGKRGNKNSKRSPVQDLAKVSLGDVGVGRRLLDPGRGAEKRER